MNVHVSYRLPKTPSFEKDIQHQIEKLRKRLQVFRPELIHLKGLVEENSPREGASVSLNLRLPSGQMAVEAKAPTATAAVRMVVKCATPDGTLQAVSWDHRFDWKAYAILLHAHNREHIAQVHRILKA